MTRIKKLAKQTRVGTISCGYIWPLPGILGNFSDVWIQLRSVDFKPNSDSNLSEVPDSKINTQDIRMCRNSAGWCDQNTFQPTIPQPIRCKRRAGDRVVTGLDVGRDVRREGALWGTPRKRDLFGPEGQDSVSSGSDVEVAKSGWPPEDEYLEEARSPRVDLANVEEFRAESGYGSARRSAIPSQTSGWSGFTSTPVPMYGGGGGGVLVQLGPISASVRGYRLFKRVGRSHGSSSAGVSPRRGRPQRGPAGAGIQAGATRSFGGGAIRTLWLSWEIGGVQTSV